MFGGSIFAVVDEGSKFLVRIVLIGFSTPQIRTQAVRERAEALLQACSS